MIDQSRLHKLSEQQKKDWLLLDLDVESFLKLGCWKNRRGMTRTRMTDVDGNRGSDLNDCEFDVRKAQLVPPITEPDGKNHDSELGKKRKVEPTLNLGRVCDEES
jgi:hypothetical protein